MPDASDRQVRVETKEKPHTFAFDGLPTGAAVPVRHAAVAVGRRHGVRRLPDSPLMPFLLPRTGNLLLGSGEVGDLHKEAGTVQLFMLRTCRGRWSIFLVLFSCVVVVYTYYYGQQDGGPSMCL